MNIISRYLSADDIVLGLDVLDKGRAFEEIAWIVERRHDVSHGEVLTALWRRERIGSTGLGHGLAVPHARLADIAAPIVLCARTRQPIAFNSPDREPVSWLFVILVPVGATAEHLDILASVTEKFSSDAFRRRLEAAADGAAVRRLFCEGTPV
jgi:nitrogen PTS system EIIA component